MTAKKQTSADSSRAFSLSTDQFQSAFYSAVLDVSTNMDIFTKTLMASAWTEKALATSGPESTGCLVQAASRH